MSERSVAVVAAELQQLEKARADGALPEAAYVAGRQALVEELNQLSSDARRPEPEPEPQPEEGPIVPLFWWRIQLDPDESPRPYQLSWALLVGYLLFQAWAGDWGWVGWLAGFASSHAIAWMVVDARQMRRTGVEGALSRIEPWKWGLFGVALWIVAMPIYLYLRARERHIPGLGSGLGLAGFAAAVLVASMFGLGAPVISWECVPTGGAVECSYWNESSSAGQACFDLVLDCPDGVHRSGQGCSNAIPGGGSDVVQFIEFSPPLRTSTLACELSFEDAAVY